MHLSLIWRGCLLGLGAAAPIGPVNVEVARRTLRGGFRAGFALGCGAVTIDVCYALLVSLGVRPLLENPAAVHSVIFRAMGLVGAAVLAYMGIGCLVQAAKVPSPADPDGKNPGSTRNYLTGLVMTALNPMTLGFWFLAVPSLAMQIAPDPGRDLPVVCAGVFFAAMTWVFAFAGVIHIAGGMGKRRWARVVDFAGGLLLLAFAVLMIWRDGRGSLR